MVTNFSQNKNNAQVRKSSRDYDKSKVSHLHNEIIHVEKNNQLPETLTINKDIEINNHPKIVDLESSPSSEELGPSCSQSLVIRETEITNQSKTPYLNQLQGTSQNNLTRTTTRCKYFRKTRSKEILKGFTSDEINTSIKMLKAIYQKVEELSVPFVRERFKRAFNTKQSILEKPKLKLQKQKTKKTKVIINTSKLSNKRRIPNNRKSDVKFQNKDSQKTGAIEMDPVNNKVNQNVDNAKTELHPRRYNLELKGYTSEEVDRSIEIYNKMQKSLQTRSALSSNISDGKLNLKKLHKRSSSKWFSSSPLTLQPKSHMIKSENRNPDLEVNVPEKLVTESSKYIVMETPEVVEESSVFRQVPDKIVAKNSTVISDNLELQTVKQEIVDDYLTEGCESELRSESYSRNPYSVPKNVENTLDVSTQNSLIVGYLQDSKKNHSIDYSKDFNPSTTSETETGNKATKGSLNIVKGLTQSDIITHFEPFNLNLEETGYKIFDQDIKPSVIKVENVTLPFFIPEEKLEEDECQKYYCKCPRANEIETEDADFDLHITSPNPKVSLECSCCKSPEMIKMEIKSDGRSISNNFLEGEATEMVEDIQKFNPVNPRWHPPRSPHNLIEESLYHDPWALLVATIFLNKTSCMCARPYIVEFLKDYSSPFEVLNTEPCKLEKYFVNIGLKKRSVQIWRMSHDFVHKKWKNVNELFGIGKYGEDAYKMFCVGDFNVQPKDRFLKIYKAWYEMLEKKNRILEANGFEKPTFDFQT